MAEFQSISPRSQKLQTRGVGARHFVPSAQVVLTSRCRSGVSARMLNSPVFGVVRVPPYPTRAFVEAWLGAGRRRFAAYPIAVAVFVAVVALSTTAWKNWGTISTMSDGPRSGRTIARTTALELEGPGHSPLNSILGLHS